MGEGPSHRVRHGHRRSPANPESPTTAVPPTMTTGSLNGDILVWNERAGTRAGGLLHGHPGRTPQSLDRQLAIAGCDDRRSLPFHKMLLEGKLPLTIGGGIGQSRVSMFLLGKAHIGEVQASVWDEETMSACQDAGVVLL